MLNATQTASALRATFSWAMAVVALTLLGPFVLPYAIDIAANEEGWRPWLIVALPMSGLIVYALTIIKITDPLGTALQITMMLLIGVMVVLAERSGFKGL